MFIVNSYALAVLFCFITMMCWGSWGNTQKLASKSWRYELFYWDYVIGTWVRPKAIPSSCFWAWR